MAEQLSFVPAADRLDLPAPAVAAALGELAVEGCRVDEIDPNAADSVSFCTRYGIALAESANCVVVVARRGGETRLAACVVLATPGANVNGLVRRHLGARKASFAPADLAVARTGMEYGGITPVGLPEGWPILVDAAVVATPEVVVGSGVRRSKLRLPDAALANLPAAEVLAGLAS